MKSVQFKIAEINAEALEIQKKEKEKSENESA